MSCTCQARTSVAAKDHGANSFATGQVRSATHIPALLHEAMEALEPSQGGRYIDGTLGAAGHAYRILELSAPDGMLLGLDADPVAVARARSRLEVFEGRAKVVRTGFSHMHDVARAHGFSGVQGVFLDLGMSSLQLADADRGFSFRADGPLDMRFDPDGATTAGEVVNRLPESELADLLHKYGEERHARRIARAICQHRPVRTARELGNLVAATVRQAGRIHPATRTFQALRISVNRELEALGAVLPQAVELLAPRGRLVVISYHSLEDRLVKEFIRRESRDCICPPELPICSCRHQATLEMVNRRVVRPTPEEVERNARSRSARLRAASRVA